MAEKFTFFKSYYEAASLMQPAERLALYDAIFGYVFQGELPESIEGTSYLAWLLVKPNIDSSIAAFESGKKGGRPSEKTTAKTTLKTGVKTPLKNPPFEKIKTDKDKEKEKDRDKEREFSELLEVQKNSPLGASACADNPALRTEDAYAVFDEVDMLYPENETMQEMYVTTMKNRAHFDDMVSNSAPCPDGLNPFKAVS